MIKENIKEIRDEFPKAIAADWADDIICTTYPTIGYKAAFIEYKNGKLKPCIIKLLIPAGASHTVYNEVPCEKYGKHRCTLAKVIGFLSYYTGKEIKVTKARSIFYDYFHYTLGEYVVPNHFSTFNWTCAGGIHYFKSLEVARCYMDSILWDIELEFRRKQMGSDPQDPEVIRIRCNEQRKNAHPAFDISRNL